MGETPVEAERAHGEPPPHRIVLDAPSWLPTEKFPRGLIIGVLIAFVSVILAATFIPFAGGSTKETSRRLATPASSSRTSSAPPPCSFQSPVSPQPARR